MVDVVSFSPSPHCSQKHRYLVGQARNKNGIRWQKEKRISVGEGAASAVSCCESCNLLKVTLTFLCRRPMDSVLIAPLKCSLDDERSVERGVAKRDGHLEKIKCHQQPRDHIWIWVQINEPLVGIVCMHVFDGGTDRLFAWQTGTGCKYSKKIGVLRRDALEQSCSLKNDCHKGQVNTQCS